MKNRYRKYRVSNEEENFWPAFTDLISTIALILFFLMLIIYINNIVTGKNLEFAIKQVEDTQKRLEASKAEISQAENQLRLLKDDLEITAAEVLDGEIALKMSQDEVDKQKEIIAESNRELGELRSKLQGIAVLRLSVLSDVKKSIEGKLGKRNEQGEELVLINSNGNIVINEGLVFEYNSYNLKAEGKQLLSKLADAFEDVLDDSNTRANIDAINIQGHTDSRGDSEYNRDLSTKRATAVINYLMHDNTNLENKYGKYFLAGGYSEFRPVSSAKTEAAYSLNRRIEISVILKDASIQDVIDEYLEESQNIFDN
ncbi:MAG: OmpA family protein [Acidaminobacteraceae bacterium]